MENKRKNIVIWFLTLIIIALLLVLGYLYFNKDKTENSGVTTTTTTTTEVVKSNYDTVGAVFTKEADDTYTLTKAVNNKDVKIKIFFKEADTEDGKYLDYDVIINDTKVETSHAKLAGEAIEQAALEDNVRVKIDIMGNYLVLGVYHIINVMDGGVNPIIINSDGKVIKTIKLTDNQSLIINDSKENNLYWEKYYVSGDKLYYLKLGDRTTSTKIDKYEVSVIDDEYSEKLIKTFDGDAAGAVD